MPSPSSSALTYGIGGSVTGGKRSSLPISQTAVSPKLRTHAAITAPHAISRTAKIP